MSPISLHAHFDLHGVRLEVHTDFPRFWDRVHTTLAAFVCADAQHAAADACSYHLNFSVAVSADDLAPPRGSAPSGASVLPDGSILETHVGGALRTQVRPGLVRVDVDDSRTVTAYVAPECSDEAIGYALLLGVFYALEHSGQCTLHSASLQTASADIGGAMLLMGESGAGKSTLAMKLVETGWGLFSDDISVLLRLEDSFHVWGFPRLAKVHQNSLAMLPWLEPFVVHRPCDADEHWVELPPDMHLPPTRTALVRMIVFLEPRNAVAHQVAPVDRIDAISRLTGSHVQARIRERGKPKFAFLADVVRTVPAYRVSLGPTLNGVGDLFANLWRHPAT